MQVIETSRKTDLNIEKLNQWKQLECKEIRKYGQKIRCFRYAFVGHYFFECGGS